MTFRPVATVLFHADRRTTDGQPDTAKLIVAFRNFEKDAETGEAS